MTALLTALAEQWEAKAKRRYADSEQLSSVGEDLRARLLDARADECREHADALKALVAAAHPPSGWQAENAELRRALVEIVRLRLATSEGSLRIRADRMWDVATAAIGQPLPAPPVAAREP